MLIFKRGRRENSTAIVTKTVPENTVVGGVPAKRICSVDQLVERLKISTATFPWRDLVNQRASGFDPRAGWSGNN